MIEVLATFVLVVVALFVTIYVHELGHLKVAQMFGIPVQGFNLGIGPVLLSTTRKNLQINLRLLPIGGYLDIEQMRFFGPPSKLPARQRVWVTLAGPISNIILAACLAGILALVGIPIYNNSTVVGFVHPDFQEKLDIRVGDKVKRLDGQSVNNWNQIRAKIFSNSQTNITMVTERNGAELTNVIPIYLREIGVPVIPMSPQQDLVRRIDPVHNRRIASVNGASTFNADTFGMALKSNLTVHVVFADKTEESFVPTESMLAQLYEVNPGVIRASPFRILGGTSYQIGHALYDILRPHSNLGHRNLSGPLTTMLYMYRWFDADVRLGLFLLMAINLNLAYFNLLPLYPLDGSHLLFSLLQNTRYNVWYQKAMLFSTFGVIMFMFYMILIDIIKVSVL